MELTLIAALAENGVIGREGGLPWRLPDDLAHFKRLTSGHAIIMGRKTWLSLGRPLPKRTNIVLSRSLSPQAGMTLVPKLSEAIEIARRMRESEVFVIGGASVYAEALPLASRLELTRVHADIVGDVRFPDFDSSGFALASSEAHAEDERHAHAFTFERWQRR